jgi:hypothetical protein
MRSAPPSVTNRYSPLAVASFWADLLLVIDDDITEAPESLSTPVAK